MSMWKTAALGLALAAGPAFADGHATGDAAAGKDVFKKCKACHSVVDAGGEVIVKGGRNGPNLYGLYQRVAGTEEAFGKKFGKVVPGELGVGGICAVHGVKAGFGLFTTKVLIEAEGRLIRPDLITGTGGVAKAVQHDRESLVAVRQLASEIHLERPLQDDRPSHRLRTPCHDGPA